MIVPPSITQQVLSKPEAAVVFDGLVHFNDVPQACAPAFVEAGQIVGSDTGKPFDQNSVPWRGLDSMSWVVSGGSFVGQEMTIPLAPDKWSNRLEREFQLLADAMVMEDITPEEAARFARLQKLRRTLKNPRSPEEVLFETRRDMMLADVVSVLTKYVHFINLGPNRSAVEIQPTGRQRKRAQA